MSFVQRCGKNLWCFLAVFLSCSILQSMVGTFVSSGIQSIERQFQIPSTKSGTLISASRLGYIPTVLFLAYFGSKGNRAKWIGAGSIIIAFGCLLAAMPNFIFPPKPVFTEVDSNFVLNSIIKQQSNNVSSMDDFLNNPVISHRIPTLLKTIMAEYENLDQFYNTFTKSLDEYFVDEDFVDIQKRAVPSVKNISGNYFKNSFIDKLSKSFSTNVSKSLMKQAELPFGFCNSTIMKLKAAVKNETCKRRKADVASNEVAYGMVFAAMMLFGVGQSLPGTLGTPLIDDSVKRKSAPFYFAAIRSIRILGPIGGLWMAAGCFKLYVTLKAPPPGLAATDPRWIGAWWLGFLIVGFLLFVPSIMMLFFPNVQFQKKKPDAKTKENENGPLIKSAKEKESGPLIKSDTIKNIQHQQKSTGQKFVDELNMFLDSIFVCLKSPIYVGVLLGRLFDAFAFRGLSSFQAKFIENHYGIPQYQVSFFSGVVGGLSYAGGLILGSIIMRNFKLDGRRAAAYTTVCTFLSIALTVSKVGLSCQSVNNAVGELASKSNFNLTSACNENCFCDKSNLYPVCSRDGKSFFSPCHAGCTNFTLNSDDGSTAVFSNCECASGDVSRDYCTSDCTVPLYLYYALTVITGIIAGTAGIPNMLISLRAVPHEVRSVSMAFSGFLVSLLSSAPSPIIVGSVIDSACLLWNNVCGRRGACLLYDAAALRIRIHSIYGILRATGLLFDIWVWYWAANLILMKEPAEKKAHKDKLSKIPPTAV